MPKGKTKSKFVGVRITEEQASRLSEMQKSAKISKTDVLLKGLDALGDIYGLGLDQKPLSLELKCLEDEAVKYATELKKVKSREQAIREMVRELRDIDKIIDGYGCSKDSLIQILLDIQKKYNWLPKHALMWVSERLDVPMAHILHIASFYKAFSLKPRGRHIVKVCLGTACHVRKGPKILESAELALGIKAGETTKDGNFTLESVNCIGCCALGPVLSVDDDYHGNLVPGQVAKIFEMEKYRKVD